MPPWPIPTPSCSERMLQDRPARRSRLGRNLRGGQNTSNGLRASDATPAGVGLHRRGLPRLLRPSWPPSRQPLSGRAAGFLSTSKMSRVPVGRLRSGNGGPDPAKTVYPAGADWPRGQYVALPPDRGRIRRRRSCAWPAPAAATSSSAGPGKPSRCGRRRCPAPSAASAAHARPRPARDGRTPPAGPDARPATPRPRRRPAIKVSIACSVSRRPSRRTRSTSRRLATVGSHASGRRGTPSLAQRLSAATSASDSASPAAKSPVRPASTASSFP